jgi:hypothetical protein
MAITQAASERSQIAGNFLAVDEQEVIATGRGFGEG